MKGLVLLAAIISLASAACPPTYMDVGGLCVYVETEMMLDYDGARDYCAELAGDGQGGDLVSPSSCDQFTYLARYLELNVDPDNGTSFYVGAKRINDGWLWLDLSSLPLGPPFWAYDKGNMEGMDCAAMEYDRMYQLTCSMCSTERNFICSAPPLQEETTRVESVKSRRDDCENGIVIGDNCYIFSRSKTTWQYAEKACGKYSDDLMTGMLFHPSGCDEFTQLVHHIAAEEALHDYWVGAIDATGDQTWYWNDGMHVPVGIPYWAFDEPSHQDHDEIREHCGLLKQSKRWYLSDAHCTEMHYYVCKVHVMN